MKRRGRIPRVSEGGRGRGRAVPPHRGSPIQVRDDAWGRGNPPRPYNPAAVLGAGVQLDVATFQVPGSTVPVRQLQREVVRAAGLARVDDLRVIREPRLTVDLGGARDVTRDVVDHGVAIDAGAFHLWAPPVV